MKTDLSSSLETHKKEHIEFFEEGEIIAAFERLAYVHNVVQNADLPNKIKYQIKDFIDQRIGGFSSFDEVKVRFIENCERAIKIMSFGSDFNDDELLLILTLLMEVELGLDLLQYSKNYMVVPQFEMANSDLDELSAMAGNRADLNSAIKMIKSNALLPITSRYL